VTVNMLLKNFACNLQLRAVQVFAQGVIVCVTVTARALVTVLCYLCVLKCLFIIIIIIIQNFLPHSPSFHCA